MLPDPIAATEAQEFAEGSRKRAIQAYRELGQSHDPQTKAEALMRAARALRGERRWNEALAALDQATGKAR